MPRAAQSMRSSTAIPGTAGIARAVCRSAGWTRAFRRFSGSFGQDFQQPASDARLPSELQNHHVWSQGNLATDSTEPTQAARGKQLPDRCKEFRKLVMPPTADAQ